MEKPNRPAKPRTPDDPARELSGEQQSETLAEPRRPEAIILDLLTHIAMLAGSHPTTDALLDELRAAIDQEPEE